MVRGWAGLAWTERPHNAARFACGVAPAAMLLMVPNASWSRRAMLWAVVTPSAYVAFFMGREAIYGMHDRFAPVLASSLPTRTAIFLVLLGLFFSGMCHWTLRWLEVEVHDVAFVGFFGTLTLGVGLAWVWAMIWQPNFSDYIHLVKLGYPVFTVPIALAVATQWAVLSEPRPR